jgi:Domain of unknown function (DUF1934).
MKSENKNVKIKIKTKISDIMMSDAYGSARTLEMMQNEINNVRNVPSDEDIIMDDYFNEVINDNIELSTSGTLSMDGDNITVSYIETELTGNPDCETSVYFNKVLPNVVTMTRTGSVVSGMVFDPSSHRQMCTYETEFLPLEFCICTRKVGNTLTYDNGGILNLDYDIEVHGIRTERYSLTLEVANVKEGDNSERR